MHDIRKKKVYVAEDDLNILFALDVMLEEGLRGNAFALRVAR
jgi:hypothetical protein